MLAEQRALARPKAPSSAPRARPASPRSGRLRESGWLRADEHVVVLNTGAGLKYPETVPL